jgi:hypothetical protein
VSEPHEPSEPAERTDRDDQAILAALAVLEAGDPEVGLAGALRPSAGGASEADVTLRRLYVETLGLLAREAPEAPADRIAAVKARVMAAVTEGGAAEPVAPPAAEVVPIAAARATPEPAHPAPRRRSWLALTALAAVFVAAALGLAGWFYAQLHETQQTLARLETERTRLTERLDRQENLIRRSAGMSDLVTAVSTAGVEICPLRPVGDPALHPKAFAVLYMPPGSGKWYLLASNLEPGQGVYKVWLNTPAGAVPVGVLGAGQDSALEFELPAEIDERHELMLSITVTLEPSPDMPDPSGPMVLFGDEKMTVL